MDNIEALDVLHKLLTAAGHPDMTSVDRPSPERIVVTYGSGSQGYLWTADPGSKATPAALPETLPHPRHRVLHLLKFVTDLLDFVRPSLFAGWETVSYPGVALSPSGLRLRGAAGGTALLRATSGSGPTDPDTPPFPDYEIPDSVRS